MIIISKLTEIIHSDRAEYKTDRLWRAMIPAASEDRRISERAIQFDLKNNEVCNIAARGKENIPNFFSNPICTNPRKKNSQKKWSGREMKISKARKIAKLFMIKGGIESSPAYLE